MCVSDQSLIARTTVLRGLRTVAVAAPGDEELVRKLGADEFGARTQGLGGAVRRVVPGGVDGALDAGLG